MWIHIYGIHDLFLIYCWNFLFNPFMPGITLTHIVSFLINSKITFKIKQSWIKIYYTKLWKGQGYGWYQIHIHCKINIFVLLIINKGKDSIIEYKEWYKYCILHVILKFMLESRVSTHVQFSPCLSQQGVWASFEHPYPKISPLRSSLLWGIS